MLKLKNKITDILEIDKNDLQHKKLTEYCITKTGWDSEIIALVNDVDTEFYTKIIKAWRADRKSGKFRKVRQKNIKKCENESYGL